MKQKNENEFASKMEKDTLQRIRKRSFQLVVCSTIGLILSSYAAYVEIQVENDQNYKAMCDVSEKISCTKVFSSSFGKGFGLFENISFLNHPNGYFGIAFYSFLVVTSFFNSSTVLKFQFLLVGFSNILSVYLAYLLYILDDFCIVCFLTYIVNFINLILLWSKCKTIKNAKGAESSYIKKKN